MRVRLFGLMILGLALGCRGEDVATDGDGDLSDDPMLLVQPADAPDWTEHPRDLRETWLGYPLAGTHTYEVHWVETNANGVETEDSTFEEARQYSTDLGIGVSSLRIEGVRMRALLDAWIGTSEDGWTRHWDPTAQSWRSVWPLGDLLEEGAWWDGPIIWFRRDSFAFSQYDGRYEVVSLDATAPDGTSGTVHITSSFAQKDWVGAYDVWFKDGPVVEERTVTDQNGRTERARSTRISKR